MTQDAERRASKRAAGDHDADRDSTDHGASDHGPSDDGRSDEGESDKGEGETSVRGSTSLEPAEAAPRRHPVLITVGLVLLAATVVGAAVSRFVVDSGDTGALSVFSRPAEASDALTGSLRFTSLGGSEVAESRRLEGSYGWDLWAVRTDDASVCLYAEREGATAGECVGPDLFVTDGVSITLPNSYAESSASSTPSVGLPVTLSWGPDDTALTFVPTD